MRSTCSRRKSKILALPRGATPVDFAYAIHSDVGDHMRGRQGQRRAGARCAPSCSSGDVVEVVTAPGARPNPAWLNFVRTGRARSKIRHYLKNMEQEESQRAGREDAGAGAARRGPAAAAGRRRRTHRARSGSS